MYLGLCLENDSKSAWLRVDFHIHSLLCFTHLLFGFFQHCFNSQLSHSIMELFSWGRSLRSSSPTINLCTITCHMYCSITCHKKMIALNNLQNSYFSFFFASLPLLWQSLLLLFKLQSYIVQPFHLFKISVFRLVKVSFVRHSSLDINNSLKIISILNAGCRHYVNVSRTFFVIWEHLQSLDISRGNVWKEVKKR